MDYTKYVEVSTYTSRGLYMLNLTHGPHSAPNSPQI